MAVGGRSGIRRRQRRKARRREREQPVSQDQAFPVQQVARRPRRERVRLLARYLDSKET